MELDWVVGIAGLIFAVWGWFSGPKKPRRGDPPETYHTEIQHNKRFVLIAVIVLVALGMFFNRNGELEKNANYIKSEVAEEHRQRMMQENRSR